MCFSNIKQTNQQSNMQILTHYTWILILTWFVFQLNLHYPLSSHQPQTYIYFLVNVLRILPKEYLMFAFEMFVNFTYFPFPIQNPKTEKSFRCWHSNKSTVYQCIWDSSTTTINNSTKKNWQKIWVNSLNNYYKKKDVRVEGI